MKNMRRIASILAVLALVFAFSGCDDDDGDNPVTSAHLGATLNLSGQVYTYTNGTYNQFSGDRAISAFYWALDNNVSGYRRYSLDGGTGSITNGLFTYSIGTPSSNYLRNISEWWLQNNMNNVKISNREARYVEMSDFHTLPGNGYLYRGFYASITHDEDVEESVIYIYVDRDVTICADHTELKGDEGYTDTFNAFNIDLKTGWNALYTKEVDKPNHEIETYSAANPSHLRWVLSE